MHDLCTFKTQCHEKNLVALLFERPSYNTVVELDRLFKFGSS